LGQYWVNVRQITTGPRSASPQLGSTGPCLGHWVNWVINWLGCHWLGHRLGPSVTGLNWVNWVNVQWVTGPGQLSMSAQLGSSGLTNGLSGRLGQSLSTVRLAWSLLSGSFQLAGSSSWAGSGPPGLGWAVWANWVWLGHWLAVRAGLSGPVRLGQLSAWAGSSFTTITNWVITVWVCHWVWVSLTGSSVNWDWVNNCLLHNNWAFVSLAGSMSTGQLGQWACHCCPLAQLGCPQLGHWAGSLLALVCPSSLGLHWVSLSVRHWVFNWPLGQ